MEVEMRGTSMWLLSMPIKAFVALFVAFGALLIGSIFIGGVLGPSVWVRETATAWGCPDEVMEYDPTNCTGVDLTVNGTAFVHSIDDVGKLNQNIDLYVSLNNNHPDTGLEKVVRFYVTIEGASDGQPFQTLITMQKADRTVSCNRGDYWCKSVVLATVSFVEFATYRFSISADLYSEWNYFGDAKFKFEWVNASNTEFELWWRFVFLILTFVAICVFAFFLRRLKFANWTVEQRWTAILLFALLGYNNPAFPLYILVDGWFPVFINQVLTTIFFAVLLLYWLVTFDGIRKESQNASVCRLYLPKLLFIGTCWGLVVTLLTWNQLHTVADPTYSYADQMGGYIFLAIAACGVIVLYLLWIGYLVWRAFVESKDVAFLGPRIRFFGGFTLFVMVLFIALIVISFLSHPAVENNAAKFLTTITLPNLYIYVLVIVFLPVKDAIKYQDVKKVQAQGLTTEPTAVADGDFPLEEFPANEQPVMTSTLTADSKTSTLEADASDKP
ncbi:transmembrane protein [Pelomyxa schiedti]|nr:transmembrane protein [Pelomyxa schiedti]